MNLRTILAVIILAGSALTQAPPTPGPEVKKLDFFVGTWTEDGTIPPGPWGAGGKYSITHTNEWMKGNFFLISRKQSRMPPDLGGETEQIGFLGYDADKKMYTATGFDSNGGQGSVQGTLSDDTWTWTGSEEYKGETIRNRGTYKMLSPNSYRSKFEVSSDGTNWLVMMEATATKK